MAHAVDEGKNGDEDEEPHKEAQGRGHKIILLADDQLEDPNEEDGAQCGIKKGGLEADAEGQAGKGQHKGHAHHRHKAPARIVEHQRAGHQGNGYGQRQQWPGDAHEKGNQQGAQRHENGDRRHAQARTVGKE